MSREAMLNRLGMLHTPLQKDLILHYRYMHAKSTWQRCRTLIYTNTHILLKALHKLPKLAQEILLLV